MAFPTNLSANASSDALEVFISYSHKDKNLLERLLVYLKALEGTGIVKIWTDKRLIAGREFQTDIGSRLGYADIVLLLVTEHFIASEPCVQEMKLALERRKTGCVVIPIIGRTCNWDLLPIGQIGVLPKEGKVLEHNREWAAEGVFTEVVDGVRLAAEALKEPGSFGSANEGWVRRQVAACFIDIRELGMFAESSSGQINHVLTHFFTSLTDSLQATIQNVDNSSQFGKWVRKMANPSLIRPLGPGAMLI